MKKITVPTDIEVSTPNGVTTLVPFASFLATALNDIAFGKGLSTLESREAVKRAFENKLAGDTVELGSTDWETIAGVVRNPTNAYVPAVMGQLLPYIYAIIHPKE